MCVYWKPARRLPTETAVILYPSGGGGSNKHDCKAASNCSYVCMQSRSRVFITVVQKEKQISLTTRGGKVMEPARSPIYLCDSGTDQNKALTGAQFSCRTAFLGTVLPTPAPFSSLFNHCLFTLSQWLNEPWLRALPVRLCRPRPALPSVCPPSPLPTHTNKHTHTEPGELPLLSHTHTHTSAKSLGRVCYCSPLLISVRYRAFVAGSLYHQGTISCSRGRRCCTQAMSATVDLLRHELWSVAKLRGAHVERDPPNRAADARVLSWVFTEPQVKDSLADHTADGSRRYGRKYAQTMNGAYQRRGITSVG